MKVFVTAKYESGVDAGQIEALCAVVRAAGMEDYCFARDEKAYDDQRELWHDALKKLRGCDALLIDVTTTSSGGRAVEVGSAFALGIPIIVIVTQGAQYAAVYDGVAAKVIRYEALSDITPELQQFAAEYR